MGNEADIKAAYALIQGVEGDVVEFGVRNGSSFGMLAQCIADGGKDRLLVGFDIWMPDAEYPSAPDESKVNSVDFMTARNAIVRELVQRRLFISYDLKQGWFREITPRQLPKKIAFAHLDCDLEQSHLEALALVWPRLQSRGVILLDDWGEPKWPGVDRAMGAFFKEGLRSFDMVGRRAIAKRG